LILKFSIEYPFIKDLELAISTGNVTVDYQTTTA
jgi:hypothetical protein